MEEIVLANYALKSLQEEREEEADGLSFCNLSLEENLSGSIHQSPRASSARSDALFEFFTSQTRPGSHSNHNEVVFCGKIIHEEEELNEYQKRDYFATIKSQSFRKPDLEVDGVRQIPAPASTRFSADLARRKCSTGGLDYHVQRVNITSLTSTSAKSRRRMFMFGPVKFKPEMELSAIKQRQLAPRPPADKAGGTSRLEVVPPSLKARSHLASVLARSFSCIPSVVGSAAVERWVGVAN